MNFKKALSKSMAFFITLTMMFTMILPITNVNAATKTRLDLDFYKYTSATNTLGDKITIANGLNMGDEFVVTLTAKNLKTHAPHGIYNVAIPLAYDGAVFEPIIEQAETISDTVSIDLKEDDNYHSLLKTLNFSPKIYDSRGGYRGYSLTDAGKTAESADSSSSNGVKALPDGWRVIKLLANGGTIKDSNLATQTLNEDTAVLLIARLRAKTPIAGTTDIKIVQDSNNFLLDVFDDGVTAANHTAYNKYPSMIATVDTPPDVNVKIMAAPVNTPTDATITRPTAANKTLKLTVPTSSQEVGANYNVYAGGKLVAKELTLVSNEVTFTPAAQTGGATADEALKAANLGGTFTVKATKAGASDSEAVTISNVPARTNTVSNPEAVTSATAKGKTIKGSKKDAVIQEAPTSDFTANATYNKDTGLEGATDIKLTVTTAVWKNTADVTANVGAEVDIYSAATCTGYVVPNATSKAVVTKSPKVEAVDAIVPLTMLANSTNNASAATILACLNTNTPTVGIRYENGTNFEQVPVTWTVDIADTFDAKGKTYHFTANVKGVSGADIKTSVTVKPITVTGTSYPELAAKSTRTVPFTGVKFATMDAVLGFTTPTAETKGAFKGNITTDATSPAVEIPYTVDYTVATTPANAIGEFGADPLALTKDFIGVVTYGDANVIPAWLTIPAGITLPAENAKVTKTVTLLAKAPVPEAKIINFPGADKMVVTQKDNSPSVGNKIAIYSADGKTLEYEATIKEQAVEGKFIIDIPSAEISAKGGKYVLKTLVGTLASEPVTVSVKAEPELVAKPTVVTVNKTLNLSFDTNISGFTVRDVTNAYTTNSNIIYVKANDGKVTMTGKKSGNTDIYIDATLVDNETKLQMDVSGMTDRLICNNSGSGSGGGGGGRPAPTTPPVPTATPTPTPTAAPDGYFDDIDDVKWAKEQIDKLAKLGFVNGVADRTFAPNNNVTRAEFTKMIVTTFGLTDTTATVDFADMTDKTAWYYQYVAAGEKAGLVKGYEEDNTFRPNAPITREEMSAMLGRACTVIGVELPKEAKPENFTDMDSIQGYAKDFVLEMQKAGIINGMGDGSFAPQANATRAQSAKIMGMIYDISSAK